MWLLSLENGMLTVSWCAELAFRTRVNMSAIGSVMVMGFSALPHRGFPRDAGDLRCRWFLGLARMPVRRLAGGGSPGGDYQLLLVTPGSSPRWAISRRQIRHRP